MIAKRGRRRFLDVAVASLVCLPLDCLLFARMAQEVCHSPESGPASDGVIYCDPHENCTIRDVALLSLITHSGLTFEFASGGVTVIGPGYAQWSDMPISFDCCVGGCSAVIVDPDQDDDDHPYDDEHRASGDYDDDGHEDDKPANDDQGDAEDANEADEDGSSTSAGNRLDLLSPISLLVCLFVAYNPVR
jgi:hypothetical protein